MHRGFIPAVRLYGLTPNDSQAASEYIHRLAVIRRVVPDHAEIITFIDPKDDAVVIGYPMTTADFVSAGFVVLMHLVRDHASMQGWAGPPVEAVVPSLYFTDDGQTILEAGEVDYTVLIKQTASLEGG